MWSLASYLLVNSPRSYHYYAGTDVSSELQSYPEDTLDIGVATRGALERFMQAGDPIAGATDARSAGNGKCASTRMNHTPRRPVMPRPRGWLQHAAACSEHSPTGIARDIGG